MLEVAKNRYVKIIDFSETVANGERIEQTLRRMFVRAITGVDDRNVEMASHEIGGTGGGVAHDEAVRLHGIQRLNGVEQRLTLFHAGGFRLKIHRVRAQARSGSAKAYACARGVFEKRQGDSFTAKGGKFF